MENIDIWDIVVLYINANGNKVRTTIPRHRLIGYFALRRRLGGNIPTYKEFMTWYNGE